MFVKPLLCKSSLLLDFKEMIDVKVGGDIDHEGSIIGAFKGIIAGDGGNDVIYDEDDDDDNDYDDYVDDDDDDPFQACTSMECPPLKCTSPIGQVTKTSPWRRKVTSSLRHTRSRSSRPC